MCPFESRECCRMIALRQELGSRYQVGPLPVRNRPAGRLHTILISLPEIPCSCLVSTRCPIIDIMQAKTASKEGFQREEAAAVF